MKRTQIASVITLFLVSSLSHNQIAYAGRAVKKNARTAPFAQKLPDFSLADPTGEKHTRKSVLKNGLVLVVTSPILSQSAVQEGWGKLLMESRSGAKAQLVFLEDMQPSNFKGMARRKMKERFEEGREPLLLFDENGKLRQALKVKREETVVLVYNKRGKLIYAESGEFSTERVLAIWKRLDRSGATKPLKR